MTMTEHADLKILIADDEPLAAERLQMLLARIEDDFAERAEIGQKLLAEALPGDRIAILGARDDSLSEFALDLVARLGTQS